MNRAFIALLLATSLAGCSTIEAITTASQTTATQVAPEAMADAKKALIAAHGLHEAVADALIGASNSNLCIDTCATQAKTYLDQSEAILVTADNAVALGDAPDISTKIASATALISQVEALIGKK